MGIFLDKFTSNEELAEYCYKNKIRKLDDVHFPEGWEILEMRRNGFLAAGKIGLKEYTIISTISLEQDGRIWHHISVTNPKTPPDYEILKFVRVHFMSDKWDAVEIHSRPNSQVNIHNHCRHLWMCLDEKIFPDFTNGSGSI